MTAVATRAEPARERTFADRFLAAVPLLSIFFWLAVVYAFEAWYHRTPWLFGDELELTQLSRSIADTGHAARRGDPHSFGSLYTYLTAPAWLMGDIHRAYSAVRYLGVIAMTLSAFPAYAIARLLVGKWASLFVAAGTAAIPALAYSSMIVEEPLAYTYSTCVLYLILRALVSRSRWWIAGAVLGCLIAPAVRDELVVLFAVLGLASVFLVWRSEQARAWRRSWSRTDWLGLVVLLVGAAVIVSAFLGKNSFEWLVSTRLYKDRLLDLGLHAGGALTIGLGVLPVVAGLASLGPLRGELRSRELSAFRSVLGAALIGFGMYTAVKATYVSTTFGTYTYERNLIYLAPLLFAGTALWLERRRAHPVAVVLSAAFVCYLLLSTPYEMGQDASYNAPGLAILQQANRWVSLTPGGAKIVLVAALALSVAALLALRFVPRRGTIVVAALAAAVLAWNLTGEIGFAEASNRASDSFLSNIRGEPSWLDRVTGGAPTLYLGQQVQDQNSEWLLEFWNRSVRKVWSLDGTVGGPGPTLTPDLHATDGLLSDDPQYRYVVAEPGIEVVGKAVARHFHRAGGGFVPWRVYEVAPPLRLRGAATGLYPDGWSGPNGSQYTRYSGGGRGSLHVTVSRERWGGPDTPGKVIARIGPLAIGSDKQPQLGPPTAVRRCVIHSKSFCSFVLRAPGPRFRVELTIPTFVPHKLVPSVSESRPLGGVVTYRFVGSRRRGS